MVYVGVWKRFYALCIDSIIFIPISVLYLCFSSISKEMALIVTPPFIMSYSIYCIYFHGRWGQTFGKMAVGIQVVNLLGDEISWKESCWRHSVALFFSALWGISLMIVLANVSSFKFDSLPWIERATLSLNSGHSMLNWSDNAESIWIWSEIIVLLFNEKKRALHDFIAGTVVIVINYENIESYCEEEEVTPLGKIIEKVPLCLFRIPRTHLLLSIYFLAAYSIF